MDEPPPDFLLLDSPNEGERGTYTCPFDGCDGVVLGSPAECHVHVKDWHSAPYSCAACSAYFAAQPALARHVKATGHQKWMCAKAGCEMKGFEFENHLEYRDHVIASASHRSLGQREAGEREADEREAGERGAGQRGAGQREADQKEADHGYGDARTCPGDQHMTDADETLSEESGDDYFMCLEPCCRRYLQRWTERKYAVHVNSHCHVAAVQEGEALRTKDLPAADLEQRQGALRMFLCDVRGCPQFGKCLATSKSYHHHLQTWNHVFPSTPNKDHDDDDFWLQPDTRHCDVDQCLQFRRRFATETAYQRHIKSVQHLRAACRPPSTRSSPREAKRVNRLLFPTVEQAERGDDDMHDCEQRSAEHSSVVSTGLPDTPMGGTPDSGLSSPTPSRRRREVFLERRNRQLQDEVQRLQAQMDWLCRQK
ncbi:hypothetical protein G6O67_005076 [Ophiocordyceps sinensis]|uniref:C2H2-type domain-containing protein n=1 Tax=Ophiocordyceps sinensis TaxID=72228 RepID=A0A8H4PQS9_9HYPO|nr:hypothetical protein G6O67_005076 [Ophiocordyceps sinensis]